MKKLLSMLFAAMYIMAMFAGRGFVLCEGPEGHVAFEAPHAQSHCSSSVEKQHESHDHHDHNEEKTVYLNQDCKPCIDTSLEMNELVRVEKNELEVSSFVVNIPLILGDSNFKHVKNLSHIPPPPRLNPTHISIRTIVFLI